MKIGKDSTFQDLIDLIKTKIPDPSNANPSMNGTASPGSSVKYAREDHTHPSDTSKFDNSGGTITGSATIQGNLEAKEVKATDFIEVLEIDYTPNKSNIVQVNVSVQSNTYNAGYRLDTGSGSGESGTLSNIYSAFRVVVTQNNEVLYNEVHRTENKLYSYDIPKGSVNVKVYCMIGSVIDGQGNLLASKAEYTDPRFLNANNLHNEDPTSDSTVYLRRQTTGGMCKINKIVGGSVVKNQKINNGNFVNGTSGWENENCTWSVTDGVAYITATAQYGQIRKAVQLIKDHKYLYSANVYATNNKIYLQLTQTSNGGLKNHSSTSGWELISGIANASSSIWAYIKTFDYSTSGWVEHRADNFNVTDLTQMFGSTIADYIYSLEQTEAGSGIAKLAEWGFDFSTYHAYDAGSLQSVKLAAKRAIGKNRLPMTLDGIKEANPYATWNGNSCTVQGVLFTINTNMDGSVTSISATRVSSGSNANLKLGTVPKGSYKMSGSIDGDSNSYFIFDGVGSPINYSEEVDFNPTSNKSIYIRVVSSYAANNVVFYPMIRFAYVTDSTYEPYREIITPLSQTDLRGIYSLDASNNLVSDGDEYYPDGGESVKYWIVDLGSLSWTKHTTQEKFYSYISGDIKGKYTGQGYGLRNAICSGYQNTDASYSSMNDKEISIGSNFTGASNCSVVVRDDTKYASMTAAQFKTAVTGIYVIYPLNTAQTAQLSPYQSLESIASNGTEEYIDYGVQQSQRDMAIPPYSFAEYTEGNADNVIASGDVIDGYNNVLREKENHRDLISLLGDDESGRTTASRAYSVNEFFYKDGAVYKVTASIASGATFTVGTNCTQTTIFAVFTALLNV